MKKMLLIALISSLAACASVETNQAKVDGSTKESTEASLNSIMNSLPNKEHCLLQTAVIRIHLGDPSLKAGNKFGEKINGLTSNQILALSEQYPASIVGLCRD